MLSSSSQTIIKLRLTSVAQSKIRLPTILPHSMSSKVSLVECYSFVTFRNLFTYSVINTKFKIYRNSIVLFNSLKFKIR